MDRRPPRATRTDTLLPDTTLFLACNGSWFFSPDHHLDATVSEGYRRGGTNGTPTTGNFAEDPAWTTYKSDTVRNHELGIKGRVGRMSYTRSEERRVGTEGGSTGISWWSP